MRCCAGMIFSYKGDAGTGKVLRQFWKRSIKCCSKTPKRFVPVQFFIIRARYRLSVHKIRCPNKKPKKVCASTIFYYKGMIPSVSAQDRCHRKADYLQYPVIAVKRYCGHIVNYCIYLMSYLVPNKDPARALRLGS